MDADLFTPDTAEQKSLASSDKKMGPPLIILTVLVALVGTAVLGVVLTVLFTIYAAKKNVGKTMTPAPYGSCSSNSSCNNGAYYVSMTSVGTSGGVVPQMPTSGTNPYSNVTLFNLSCCPTAATDQVSASLPATLGDVYSLETVPGVYLFKAHKYIKNINDDLSKIDLKAYFVPNNGFLAASQVLAFLEDVEISKPPFAGLTVWCDASKILTNNGVVKKIAKLGGTSLTSTTTYQVGMPYIFAYINGSNKFVTDVIEASNNVVSTALSGASYQTSAIPIQPPPS